MTTYQRAVLADAPIGYWRMGTAVNDRWADRSAAGSWPLLATAYIAESVAPSLLVGDEDPATAYVGTRQSMVAYAPDLDDRFSTSFTVELLFRIDSIDPAETNRSDLLAFVVPSLSPTMRVEVDPATGAMTLHTHRTVGGNSVFADYPLQTITFGAVHHLTFSFTAGFPTPIRVTLDGVAVDVSADVVVPNQLALNVWSGLVGAFDEVAVYDEVLSPARIAAHITAATTKPDPTEADVASVLPALTADFTGFRLRGARIAATLPPVGLGSVAYGSGAVSSSGTLSGVGYNARTLAEAILDLGPIAFYEMGAADQANGLLNDSSGNGRHGTYYGNVDWVATQDGGVVPRFADPADRAEVPYGAWMNTDGWTMLCVPTLEVSPTFQEGMAHLCGWEHEVIQDGTLVESWFRRHTCGQGGDIRAEIDIEFGYSSYPFSYVLGGRQRYPHPTSTWLQSVSFTGRIEPNPSPGGEPLGKYLTFLNNGISPEGAYLAWDDWVKGYDVRPDTPFTIGNSPNGDDWFRGTVSHVALFDRPLTHEELKGLYDVGLPTPMSMPEQISGISTATAPGTLHSTGTIVSGDGEIPPPPVDPPPAEAPDLPTLGHGAIAGDLEGVQRAFA